MRRGVMCELLGWERSHLDITCEGVCCIWMYPSVKGSVCPWMTLSIVTTFNIVDGPID